VAVISRRASGEAIENRYNVRIIEKNKNARLPFTEPATNTIVLHASASDKELLIEENIEERPNIFLLPR